MVLRNIEIINFKNIAETSLEFPAGVNCILGDNGMGKSNLLEAIHFLCLARPMSSIPESALLRHGTDLMSVRGDFVADNGSDENVRIGIVRGKGKSLKRNGKEYDRLSRHIGAFPIVSVTPRDSELVSGSGEERRRLTDMVISQSNPAYLNALVRYNRSLESRNRMLRAGMRDPILYESVETGMEESAEIVSSARRRWVERIAPVAGKYYSLIAGDNEVASLSYKSVVNDTTLHDVLARSRGKDTALGYTSQGIHRDDLYMSLDGYSMRRLGSQGQVKTFVLALRLAIFDFLKETGGMTPLLLLDDIFDKLDSGRVGRIMQLVSSADNFRQIFITDTNRQHLDEILSFIEGDRRLFGADNGQFRILE
ncbi:MAG: DNA replication and repair protein RecF [Clostridium sp.]|nr:DNA replication and repair protein RecF [Prevotella sp.]MCM1428452.1 DNA replication and repair protein RecF [Clostridium sp.]MCM1474917.1 DNA replication and repair protein RecF [Muribaculaceae bacterium]